MLFFIMCKMHFITKIKFGNCLGVVMFIRKVAINGCGMSLKHFVKLERLGDKSS